MKTISFDIEITKEIPEGTDDWKPLRPLGISCAATHVAGELPITWHGPRLRNGQLRPSMTPIQCCHLAQYLVEARAEGYTIVTFNGLGFDFDILAEECRIGNIVEAIAGLALDHVDIFFAMLCEKGYGIGLNTAAKGMGLAGKTKGMHGALAPAMWAQGEQNKVLEYVKQDVITTTEVYEAIVEMGHLVWTSKKGRLNTWSPKSGRLLTVSEALELPEPNTSWMDRPFTREKFCGWALDKSSEV